MNPFENPVLVESYRAWYGTKGRRADRLEKILLLWLLAGFLPVHMLLEVGCCMGFFTRCVMSSRYAVREDRIQSA